jgi:hypothetical protein
MLFPKNPTFTIFVNKNQDESTNRYDWNLVKCAKRGLNLDLLEELVRISGMMELCHKNTGLISYQETCRDIGDAILSQTGF